MCALNGTRSLSVTGRLSDRAKSARAMDFLEGRRDGVCHVEEQGSWGQVPKRGWRSLRYVPSTDIAKTDLQRRRQESLREAELAPGDPMPLSAAVAPAGCVRVAKER